VSRAVLDPRIVNAIAVVVTILWVANFVARLVIPDYNPSPAVDAAMTLVLGAALGSQFIRRRENG
jgi:hypothetical protein